jgi:beta-ribofuranosylaminobenzene 5'-phosphate synthase
LQATEQSRLANIAQNFAKSPVRIEISGEMPSHYGFGSATGIRLATLEAIAAVTGNDIERAGLIRASGRGGTSGIGVTTYFDGGLVFDVGIKNARLALLPSSVLEGARPFPLVITKLEMPAWKIGLCVPSDISPQTEEQEVTFFKRACPISAAAAKEALYQVIYGAIASAKERDFTGFCDAIKVIQRCTWKKLERDLYGEPFLSVEQRIYEAGASAVGMSSLGPGLFFLGNDVEAITARLQTALPQHAWMVAACHNSGRNLISP